MGYSPWGHKELDTTHTHTRACTHKCSKFITGKENIVQISLLMGNTKKERKIRNIRKEGMKEEKKIKEKMEESIGCRVER